MDRSDEFPQPSATTRATYVIAASVHAILALYTGYGALQDAWMSGVRAGKAGLARGRTQKDVIWFGRDSVFDPHVLVWLVFLTATAALAGVVWPGVIARSAVLEHWPDIARSAVDEYRREEAQRKAGRGDKNQASVRM
jgi:hypothetical protein